MYRLKTTHMKNINIPEPCSEDWNEMTPNEKGAFCQKCALDVYDFTNKSSDEIRNILTVNIGSPVCMRIESKQLDKLNNDFSAWKMDNKHSYQRALVFTLLVVFGMTLFSCEEDEEPVIDKFQKIGQTILNQDDDKKVIDPLKPVDLEVQSKSSIVDQPDHGAEPIQRIKQMITVKGNVRYDLEDQSQPLDEVVVVGDPIPMREYYTTAGIPIISERYNLYLLETYEGVVDSVDIDVEPKITGLVYPNPASNQTTLQINMPNRGKGEIQLFALSGQKIRTIHSGRLKNGESEYPIDLTDLETGMYLVVVYSGELKKTIKFSKI